MTNLTTLENYIENADRYINSETYSKLKIIDVSNKNEVISKFHHYVMIELLAANDDIFLLSPTDQRYISNSVWDKIKEMTELLSKLDFFT